MYDLKTLRVYAAVAFVTGSVCTFAIMMAVYAFYIKKPASAPPPKSQSEFQAVEMYGKTSTIDETAEDDPEAKPT